MIGCNNDVWFWKILFHKVKIKVLEFSKWTGENCEIRFSTEFSSDCLERLKKFKALWTVLWPFSYKQRLRGKHKKPWSHSLELLSIEPNVMVVSWVQICDNPHTFSLSLSLSLKWGRMIKYFCFVIF